METIHCPKGISHGGLGRCLNDFDALRFQNKIKSRKAIVFVMDDIAAFFIDVVQWHEK